MSELIRQESILTKIQKYDEWTIGALIALYQCQTSEEQSVNSTVLQNDIGFNAFDAPILSDMSHFYLKRGYLTKKQIDFIRRTITKYQRQLEILHIEPHYSKTSPQPKKFVPKTEMFAGMYKSGTRIQIRFKFPYGDERFNETKTKIKSLVEAKYDVKSKTWDVKLNQYNLMQLKDWGFEFGKSLQDYYNNNKVEIVPLDSIINIPGVKYPLYGFQGEGVSFIESHNGKALIADEMGLGKTVQALAWIQWKETKGESVTPAVIIVPASVKLGWKREAKKWCPDLKVSVLDGRPDNSISNIHTDIIIVNYDIMSNFEEEIEVKDENGKPIQIKDEKGNITTKKEIKIKTIGWAERLKDIKPKTVIIDEGHYLKNSDAKRTQATMKFAKPIKNIIALTGTPIVSRPLEFWNLLTLLAPDHFDSFWHYVHTYCGATKTKYGWDFSGASNTRELFDRLKLIMLRRKKEDVLKDLPPKQIAVVPITIDNMQEYIEAEEYFSRWYKPNYGTSNALERIETLKQLSVKGKINGIIKWIENFLESDEKLTVFSYHHLTTDILKENLKQYGVVQHDGRINQKQKQKAIDQFSVDDNIKIFLGQIKASGTGVDKLQGTCSNSCFTEFPWTPTELDQAIDRLHRIGQKNSVTAWCLVGENTVDEDIIELIDEKRAVISEVVDGVEFLEEDKLTTLLNEAKEGIAKGVISRILNRNK